ncbi:MAG: ArsR/SmtB family transcription factor [Solirubrobacteraceae bacterium]|jgi:DNA-binding transcriptional ArsR family regulator
MKPYHDITDPKLAKALAHPLRTRILAALEGRTASPSDLATEVGASLGVISYHVRRLQALGFIKLVKRVPRRGAVEHYYTAIARPRITDTAWAATPLIVKQATITAALDQIGAYVSAAAAVGGFDTQQAHLTRCPLTVDEMGFTVLARELEALTARIQKIEADSAKRLTNNDHDGEQQATVVLMLFNSPAAGAPANATNRPVSTQPGRHITPADV